MAAGRPSAFKRQFIEQAKKLCALGATDREVAEFFEVSERTVYRWQHEHPEFCQSLKVGKEVADERVARSLYRRAVGYTFDSVKIMQHQGQPLVIPYEEHIAPDTTAAIFWLKNRRPAEWRERVEHTGRDGGPIVTKDLGATELARRVALALAQATDTQGQG